MSARLVRLVNVYSAARYYIGIGGYDVADSNAEKALTLHSTPLSGVVPGATRDAMLSVASRLCCASALMIMRSESALCGCYPLLGSNMLHNYY